MAGFNKSLKTLRSMAMVGGIVVTAVPLSACFLNPCAAKSRNPCAPRAANPCGPSNPCAPARGSH